MTVTALGDQAGWKKWKVDIEGLQECSVPGMADMLEMCRSEDKVVGSELVDDERMWARKDRL